MAYTTRRGTVAKKIRRGPGKRMVEGKSFRLADEVRYIQQRAAEHDDRVVSFGLNAARRPLRFRSCWRAAPITTSTPRDQVLDVIDDAPPAGRRRERDPSNLQGGPPTP